MTASADHASADAVSPSVPSARSGRSIWVAIGAVVVGHLALLVVGSDPFSTPVLLAIEVGVFVVAAASEVLFGGTSRRTLGALAVVWFLLVGVSWLAVRVWDLLAVALVLAGLIALGCYAIHRIELVALGLVEVSDEQE